MTTSNGNGNRHGATDEKVNISTDPISPKSKKVYVSGTIHPDIQKVIEISFPPDLMISRAGNCNFGVTSPKKNGPLLCGAANKNGINILDKNVLLPNGDVCLCCMDYLSLIHI